MQHQQPQLCVAASAGLTARAVVVRTMADASSRALRIITPPCRSGTPVRRPLPRRCAGQLLASRKLGDALENCLIPPVPRLEHSHIDKVTAAATGARLNFEKRPAARVQRRGAFGAP